MLFIVNFYHNTKNNSADIILNLQKCILASCLTWAFDILYPLSSPRSIVRNPPDEDKTHTYENNMVFKVHSSKTSNLLFYTERLNCIVKWISAVGLGTDEQRGFSLFAWTDSSSDLQSHGGKMSFAERSAITIKVKALNIKWIRHSEMAPIGNLFISALRY